MFLSRWIATITGRWSFVFRTRTDYPILPERAGFQVTYGRVGIMAWSTIRRGYLGGFKATSIEYSSVFNET